MMSDKSVPILEFDLAIPALGLILSQNPPIKLTEQLGS